MKKTVTAFVVSALLLVGVACGGSSKSGKELYAEYVNHYGYVAEALGAEDEEWDTYEVYAAGLEGEDCEPLEGEALAFVGLFVGATLAEHGDDVAGFAKDTNELLEAVKADGYCK